jgi:hypothetical protein
MTQDQNTPPETGQTAFQQAYWNKIQTAITSVVNNVDLIKVYKADGVENLTAGFENIVDETVDLLPKEVLISTVPQSDPDGDVDGDPGDYLPEINPLIRASFLDALYNLKKYIDSFDRGNAGGDAGQHQDNETTGFSFTAYMANLPEGQNTLKEFLRIGLENRLEEASIKAGHLSAPETNSEIDLVKSFGIAANTMELLVLEAHKDGNLQHLDEEGIARMATNFTEISAQKIVTQDDHRLIFETVIEPQARIFITQLQNETAPRSVAAIAQDNREQLLSSLFHNAELLGASTPAMRTRSDLGFTPPSLNTR